MSSIFRIQEHTIPTSHIREYPRALAEDQEDVLQLAIKQYTPIGTPQSTKNAVTVIGAHANGFPKVRSFSDFDIFANVSFRNCMSHYGMNYING